MKCPHPLHWPVQLVACVMLCATPNTMAGATVLVERRIQQVEQAEPSDQICHSLKEEIRLPTSGRRLQYQNDSMEHNLEVPAELRNARSHRERGFRSPYSSCLSAELTAAESVRENNITHACLHNSHRQQNTTPCLLGQNLGHAGTEFLSLQIRNLACISKNCIGRDSCCTAFITAASIPTIRLFINSRNY